MDDSARMPAMRARSRAGETHYSVLLVSAAFHGMTGWRGRARCMRRWPRSSPAGMHALALTLRTPEEYGAG